MSSTPDNLQPEREPELGAEAPVPEPAAASVSSEAEGAPVAEETALAVAEEIAPPPPVDAGPPPIENPVWGGLDLVWLLAVLLGGMFIALMVTAIGRTVWNTTHHLPNDAGIAKPDAFTVLPVELLAYLAFLVIVAMVLRRRHAGGFGAALQWNFPTQRWWAYLCGGVALAVMVGALSHILPIPKTVPLDDFFNSPAAAWMMMLFGVLIAPPVEEVLFRGLIYPVLVRWLGAVFAEPKRLRNGALALFVVGCWGAVGHLVSGAVNSALVLLLPFFLALPVAAFRIGKPGVNAVRVAGWAATLLVWGGLMHIAQYRMFALASMLLFGATVAMAALSMRAALTWRTATLTGLALAAVVTSGGFAMLHAEQLGGAWAPLALIFLVGLTLTVVRAVTHSVGASTLVHMGYNGTLFALLYKATDGFQHLERMSR